MNNISKYLLIVLLLMIAGIMGIMYGFNNHWSIPVYYAKDSVNLGENKGYKITSAHEIPDFRFVNQDNQLITKADLKDKIVVFDFIFTRCPKICPTMTKQMTRVQEMYEKDPMVRIITVTVDPEHDTISVLKNYAKKYSAIAGKWDFLGGKKAEIYPFIHHGFFSTVVDSSETPDIPAFIHSEKMILVDKKGWIRGYYNGLESDEVNRLNTEIRVLEEIYTDGDE